VTAPSTKVKSSGIYTEELNIWRIMPRNQMHSTGKDRLLEFCRRDALMEGLKMESVGNNSESPYQEGAKKWSVL
jgi:hypothetical protein